MTEHEAERVLYVYIVRREGHGDGRTEKVVGWILYFKILYYCLLVIDQCAF